MVLPRFRQHNTFQAEVRSCCVRLCSHCSTFKLDILGQSAKGTENPHQAKLQSMNPPGRTSFILSYLCINKSTNVLAKRNSSSESNQANMTAKQFLGTVESSDPLAWLSSWLPSAGPAPAQATKKPMPSPSKGMSIYHPPPGYMYTCLNLP
jgi:hypothetical protein